MAFLDIKAAYDSVDWSKLWQKCLQRGLPERIVGLLRGLFDHNRAYVAIAGRELTGFELEAGVLQGSLLSPLLYSVFIDELVLALNQRGPEDVVYVYVSDRGYQSIHISTRPFRCLLYADDIVLVATCQASLEVCLRLCELHSLINRYRFNTSKCEIVASLPLQMQMHTGPGEDTAPIP